MKASLPGSRHLIITWVMLMTLTLLSMFSAQLSGEARLHSLPLWAALLLLASTGFKAHQVLMVYLNLRASTSGWQGLFIGLMVTTILLVGASYLVGV